MKKLIMTISLVVILLAVAWGYFVIQPKYYSDMDEIYEEFQEEIEIAGSTSRMNVGSAIRELRDVQDELEDLSKPFWISSETQDYLMDGMDSAIDGFVAFAGQDEDSEIAEHFSDAGDAFRDYRSCRP